MEEGFLRAILENPLDETPWLVLGDWLEEHSDPRAELLRPWLALRHSPATTERLAWEQRVQTLLASGGAPCVPILTNSIGMHLVLVPPGKFLMGSPPDEPGRDDSDEGPVHEVEITRPYYLGIYPVTQAQYRRVLRRTPSYFRPKGPARALVQGLDTDSFPVDNVSWDDTQAFCARLSSLKAEQQAKRGYRLPTEAEWEYACRAAGTSSAPFHLGRSLSSTQANFDGNRPYGDAPEGPYLERPAPVGSYPPNALGLFDMHGNIWEWCADWYDNRYYSHSGRRNPRGPRTGSSRVLRGGCWSGPGDYGRAADRGRITPANRYRIYGFRVALDAPIPRTRSRSAPRSSR